MQRLTPVRFSDTIDLLCQSTSVVVANSFESHNALWGFSAFIEELYRWNIKSQVRHRQKFRRRQRDPNTPPLSPGKTTQELQVFSGPKRNRTPRPQRSLIIHYLSKYAPPGPRSPLVKCDIPRERQSPSLRAREGKTYPARHQKRRPHFPKPQSIQRNTTD